MGDEKMGIFLHCVPALHSATPILERTCATRDSGEEVEHICMISLIHKKVL